MHIKGFNEKLPVPTAEIKRDVNSTLDLKFIGNCFAVRD